MCQDIPPVKIQDDFCLFTFKFSIQSTCKGEDRIIANDFN